MRILLQFELHPPIVVPPTRRQSVLVSVKVVPFGDYIKEKEWFVKFCCRGYWWRWWWWYNEIFTTRKEDDWHSPLHGRITLECLLACAPVSRPLLSLPVWSVLGERDQENIKSETSGLVVVKGLNCFAEVSAEDLMVLGSDGHTIARTLWLCTP